MAGTKSKPKALFVLPQENYERLFGLGAAQAITELVDLVADRQDREHVLTACPALGDVELLFTGWGAPVINANFLAAAPKLKVVFYGAGSIRGVATEAMWARGVRISSASSANAVPVAEFALSHILLALKQTWQYVRLLRRDRTWEHSLPITGAFGGTVGIISLGQIGRRVCEHLKRFDMEVIAYDPLATAEQASHLGVELVPLAELFSRADVVSLHAPRLPETIGMITGQHLAAMKPYATFINTARGAIVCENEMIQVLRNRPDLLAVLDVTDPEPPPADSALYELDNVVLTPHIAGSLGRECARMGWMMVDELKRYLVGQPLTHEVTRQQAKTLA